MIEITVPILYITMLKENYNSENNREEKKSGKVVTTIEEIQKFNSIKEEYFVSQKECGANL